MLSMTGTPVAAAGAGQGSSPVAPQPRLIHAAHEFEAQMMRELLKPMSGKNGLDGEDGDSATGSGGALGEFASEALGQALSERGGFGIATGIVRQLSHAGNSPVTARVTGNPHGNTGMSFHK
jgi:flagellar protein FlgJ